MRDVWSITVEINDVTQEARAEFRRRASPEPYVILIEPGPSSAHPYQVNDSSDADPAPCPSWAVAVAVFRDAVALAIGEAEEHAAEP